MRASPGSVDSSSRDEITQLLAAWTGGDQNALTRLTALVYNELYRLARRELRREWQAPSVHASDLLHEAYFRLLDASRVRWHDRAHFFAVTAQLMRRILVDFARSRQAQKRGRHRIRVTLADDLWADRCGAADLIEIHEALDRLAELDTRKAKVVELRFFGGLNIEETAEALQISSDTVARDWIAARAWLRRSLKSAK